MRAGVGAPRGADQDTREQAACRAHTRPRYQWSRLRPPQTEAAGPPTGDSTVGRSPQPTRQRASLWMSDLCSGGTSRVPSVASVRQYDKETRWRRGLGTGVSPPPCHVPG